MPETGASSRALLAGSRLAKYRKARVSAMTFAGAVSGDSGMAAKIERGDRPYLFLPRFEFAREFCLSLPFLVPT
jgi:hypothetical protein